MKRLWPLLFLGCSSGPEPAKGPEPGDFPVRVVYLIPADQERIPAYEKAIGRCVDEVRRWYAAKAGVTFATLPLEVVQSKEDYLTMRCGTDPAERAKGAEQRMHMPRWIESVERAVGGWRPRAATLVFAQGGGGVAVANLQGDFAGWCMVGDWVLEPISGVANPKGITAAMCGRKIFVTGGTPVGTVVHELGHAFGVHHPDGYEPGKKSIMRGHWDWPDTSFFAHEQLVLANSPFTAKGCWHEGAPFADYATDDWCVWGATLDVKGRGFEKGDEVEFLDLRGPTRVAPESVAPDAIRVRVPPVGPGVLRVVRGSKRSNAVPVNVYEKEPK